MSQKVAAIIAMLTVLGISGQERKTKAPEVEVSQITVRRVDEQMIAADGSITNTGSKPVNKLLLVFEFFAPGKQSITIQKGPTDSNALQPGEVAEFHLQLRAPARAVRVTVNAEDGTGRELRIGKTGPYPVE